MQEGVIKFQSVHRAEGLAEDIWLSLRPLLGWRRVLYELGMVGRQAGRYEGAAYGNLSARLPPYGMRIGARSFVITGSQTSGASQLTSNDFCIVDAYEFAQNRVQSRGSVHPSSESLTHAALYDLDGELRCVFHVHAPRLWHAAGRLALPVTNPAVAYGTVEMAKEARRLYRHHQTARHRVIVMGGHEDGVLGFGRSPDEAGQALVTAMAAAS